MHVVTLSHKYLKHTNKKKKKKAEGYLLGGKCCHGSLANDDLTLA